MELLCSFGSMIIQMNRDTHSASLECLETISSGFLLDEAAPWWSTGHSTAGHSRDVEYNPDDRIIGPVKLNT